MAFTYLDYASEVLSQADKPLTPAEIWEEGEKLRLRDKLSSIGQTPASTVGARLYADTKYNMEDSKFFRVTSAGGPVRFYLASRKDELPENFVEEMDRDEEKEKRPKSGYSEKDLHLLVSYFVYSSDIFNRGRSILTKTIPHETSARKGYSEWSNPDMVGFYLPIDEWKPELIELNNISDNNALKLFSFELKKSLAKGNYRESFFQAVSNSSWANEGYLVAAEISEDEGLSSELGRLSAAFGIGVIILDLDDIDASKVLYPAQTKPQLDWETMNKLSEQNEVFRQFIRNVKIDFQSNKIHKSEYEEVLPEPEVYIKKIRGSKSSS